MARKRKTSCSICGVKNKTSQTHCMKFGIHRPFRNWTCEIETSEEKVIDIKEIEDEQSDENLEGPRDYRQIEWRRSA